MRAARFGVPPAFLFLPTTPTTPTTPRLFRQSNQIPQAPAIVHPATAPRRPRAHPPAIPRDPVAV